MALIDHYKQVAAQGKKVPEMNLPDLPFMIRYIWDLWFDMRNEHGEGPISSKFVCDYMAIQKSEPDAIELKVIKAIDREYLEAINGRYS